MPRARIPADVARVVGDFEDLGRAARRALFVSEHVAEWQVRQAAARAAVLAKRLRPAAKTRGDA